MIKRRNLSQSGRIGLGLVLAVGLIGSGGRVAALPSGGNVTAGQGQIRQTDATLTIRQVSDRLALDWQGFDIAPDETVSFVQPDSDSLAFNRVLGADPSRIAGRLDANGRVFLLNPNGVLFTESAQVNVGGLIASSLAPAGGADGIDAEGFDLAGAGPGAGAVVNRGRITSDDGGFVVLAAPVASNAGTIAAPEGDAALAAGNAVQLRFDAQGHLTASVSEPAAGAQAANSGRIEADGGRVRLTAAAAAANPDPKPVVNNTGVIRARTVAERNGRIELLGDPEAGTVQVAGTLDASAPEGGDGGFIETSGARVHVADGAWITTDAADGQSGTWLIDPNDYTIASGGDINGPTLSANLGNGDVTIDTRSAGTAGGNGDIFVNDTVSWSSTHTLTLNAERNIAFNADLTVAGGGGVALTTGADGDYGFNGGHSLSFTDGPTSGASLTINGTPYTLLYDLGDVQAINASDTVLNGAYALAISLDATTDPPATGWIPLGTDGANTVLNGGDGFAGTFTGLGHTISNLTVDIGSNRFAGLFGYSTGTIRDIGLVGGSVEGEYYVGGLVGWLAGGTIKGAYATGAVSGNDEVGGLVGNDNAGTIRDSYASGVASGDTYVGGLVGLESGGTITGAFATGAVSGNSEVGGLVGWLAGGSIRDAYATGAVSGWNYVGGLAGSQGGGTAITGVFASGAVRGNENVGGLAGAAFGAISDAYATGAVTGNDQVGGLVGKDGSGGTISHVFATGAVNGNTFVGGLVGDPGLAAISDAFWDTDSSGQDASAGGSPLSTAQLQNGLPGDFSDTVWGTSYGLYPYLKHFYPATAQKVSGTAFRDAAGSVLASDETGPVTVGLLVDGTDLGVTATTGADGYYYLLLPAGTLSGTQNVLTYVKENAVKANTLLQWPVGSVSNADLIGGYVNVLSGAATTRAMLSGFDTAVGGRTSPDFLYSGGALAAGTSLAIRSSNAGGLAIDDLPSVKGATLVLGARGPVTQTAAITSAGLLLEGGSAAFQLDAAGNQVGAVAADVGAVSLTDGGDLTVGAINGISGVTSAGSATLVTAGALHIAAGSPVTVVDGDAVLAAAGAFTNEAGSGAVNVTGGGRWLIYSRDPADDAFGGLDSGHTALWNATHATLPPAEVIEPGNRYLFARQPTLTITTTDVSKTYGEVAAAQVAAAYTVSGLDPGVRGAYLADTATSVYTGEPLVTSLGAAAGAGVSGSPYAITATAGSIALSSRYALTFTNAGRLTVNPVTSPAVPSVDDDLYRSALWYINHLWSLS